MTKPLIVLILALLITSCGQKNKKEADNSLSAEPASSSENELAEAPDEMLSKFSVSGYTTGGKKQWDLEGNSANIMTETIELEDVTSKVYGKDTNMTIVADKGSLNRLDNNVHLEQNVQATTDDGTTMNTDSLDWDAKNQKLASDAPVSLKRGMLEAMGTGIVGQPALNSVELKKDVTVKLALQDQTASAAGPTVITCDGPLEVEYEKNLAVFQDNVKVKDSRGEIFAHKMDVYFTTQSDKSKQIEGMAGMGIKTIVATGDVEIHQGGNITHSQKAVYDADTGKLTLTGQPQLMIYSTEGFSQMMGTSKKNEAQTTEEKEN